MVTSVKLQAFSFFHAETGLLRGEDLRKNTGKKILLGTDHKFSSFALSLFNGPEQIFPAQSSDKPAAFSICQLS